MARPGGEAGATTIESNLSDIQMEQERWNKLWEGLQRKDEEINANVQKLEKAYRKFLQPYKKEYIALIKEDRDRLLLPTQREGGLAAEDDDCPSGPPGQPSRDAPPGMGWCMALEQFLECDQLKVSHVYQRRWPSDTAEALRIKVDGPRNMLVLQKKIRLLDPELAGDMINNDIKDSSDAPVRYSALEGKLLEFVTEARPVKRSLAFHAEILLQYGRLNKWTAAEIPKEAVVVLAKVSLMRDEFADAKRIVYL
ncbi:g6053 [Coccomyxa elongata]